MKDWGGKCGVKLEMGTGFGRKVWRWPLKVSEMFTKQYFQFSYSLIRLTLHISVCKLLYSPSFNTMFDLRCFM